MPFPKGQVLEIRREGFSCLNIAEIEVFDREGKKFSIEGSSVVASSERVGGSYAAKNVVDGDKTNTMWFSKASGRPHLV